jgi:hypothetical protein
MNKEIRAYHSKSKSSKSIISKYKVQEEAVPIEEKQKER